MRSMYLASQAFIHIQVVGSKLKVRSYMPISSNNVYNVVSACLLWPCTLLRSLHMEVH